MEVLGKDMTFISSQKQQFLLIVLALIHPEGVAFSLQYTRVVTYNPIAVFPQLMPSYLQSQNQSSLKLPKGTDQTLLCVMFTLISHKHDST